MAVIEEISRLSVGGQQSFEARPQRQIAHALTPQKGGTLGCIFQLQRRVKKRLHSLSGGFHLSLLHAPTVENNGRNFNSHQSSPRMRSNSHALANSHWRRTVRSFTSKISAACSFVNPAKNFNITILAFSGSSNLSCSNASSTSRTLSSGIAAITSRSVMSSNA